MRSLLNRRMLWSALAGVVFLAPPLLAQQATVSGRVTDQGTNQPIAGARVQVIGTAVGAVTNAQGTYTLKTSSVGNVELRVVALGFASITRAATLTAGQATTVDWALRAVPFALEEIVTTAAGEQLTRELGNAVSRIDAGKLAETAPVANLTDVLGGGRVAGVTVLANDGTPGAGSRIRVRGLSSASLSNDPLLYIDGVRVSERGVPLSIYVGGGSPSFLNDLNPEEIESIEIVKGPSAATLYGTQAANGVIRVTTKKGKAGPPRWQVYGEYGAVKDVTDYPKLYYSKAVGNDGTCLPWQQAQGTCQIEKLYIRDVFNETDYTPRRDGYRYQLGTQVSGGTDAARYFFAAEYEDQMGQIKMPIASVNLLKELRGVDDIPEYQKNPSTLQKINLRSNVGATLGSRADVNFSLGYVYNNNLIPQTGDNLEGVIGSAILGSADPRLEAPWGFADPAYGLSHTVYRKSDHFTPSATFNYRPLNWLTARATAGLDYLGYRDEELARNGEACPFCGNDQGIRSLNRFVGNKISAEVGATATFKLTQQIGSKTSIGGQFNKDVVKTTLNSGTVLPPGGETFTGAAVKNSSEQTTEFRTLGTYIEQQFSYKERFFLTGAVRIDRNSAFGQENRSATYPKVSFSWMALENTEASFLNSFRLRGAYGQSGQQPGALAAITYLTPIPAVIFGQGAIPGATIGGLGNTAVKPERSAEIETGFDASLWRDRITLEFTYYDKKTTDALINRELPGSLGAVATQVENIGTVTNKGVEVSAMARIFEGRSFTWDFGAEFATNKNRLEELAPGIPPLTGFGYRNAPGYPLFGQWWPDLKSFDDANGNGVIEPNEVVVTDTAVFLGSTVPTKTLGITSSFGFFQNRLRLLGALDYKGGYVSHNINGLFQCAFIQNCRELNDPNASLFDQARAVAGPAAFGGFAEDASFVRLRELSLTYDLPASWVKFLRGRTAAVTLTGRNLALWTDFTSWDPELSTPAGITQDASPYNFVQEGQPRSFIFRINIGF
ncbi:MAG TPA: SusC/RagA family TonB-linked outer membrane protein [Gemmatimonadales bacterium]|nr:SusC/RagA family TonB-linked outer membrane protein [Gemmatimonadales bacterium]